MTPTLLDAPASLPDLPPVGPTRLREWIPRVLDALGSGRRFLIEGVSWDDYFWFDEQRDELFPQVRLNYSDGRLEVATTYFIHDNTSGRLQDIIKAFCSIRKIPVRSGGRATFRRADLKKGLEPDECFYIQNQSAVKGLREIDLRKNPPPDLCIEVEFSRTVMPKLPIYAALGVPEVWRYRDGQVSFWISQPDETYIEQATSRALISVTSETVSRLLELQPDDDGEYLLAIQDWVRNSPAPNT